MHDSPDYYQLKISVFNDDKKTELIGESWVDLRDIIVDGGGQNDLWHQLTCKGKYAGEIRIEITFYDSRPKPEKPAVKAKPPVASDHEGSAIPRASKLAGPKRRPLPSGPGQAAASPAAVEPSAQTPTRPQPNGPLAYIPNQSPLQQMEYNTPPPGPRYPQAEQFSSAHTSPSVYGVPPQQYHTPERQDTRYHYDERNGNPNMQIPPFARSHQQHHQGQNDMYQVDEHGVSPEHDRPPPPPVHRIRHNSVPAAAQEQLVARSSFDGLPPKPTPPTIRHEVLRNEAHRHSQPITATGGAYPGQPVYRPYNPASASTGQLPQYSSPGEVHHPSPPRHQSYDAAYDAHHMSMQPTVEDAPESPDQYTNQFRRSGSRVPQYEAPSQSRYGSEYEQTSSPAPLNVQGQTSSTSLNNHSPQPPQDDRYRRHSSFTYEPHEQPPPARYPPAQDQFQAPPPSNYTNDRGQQMLSYQGDLDSGSGRYGVPPVPSSLVPGVDLDLAMEINQRVNEDRRTDRRYNQPPSGDRRSYGGHAEYGTESPTGYGSSQYSRGRTSQSYAAPPPEYPPSTQPSAYPPNNHRNPSPNPHHTIKRKSISPAPPPAASETRRLSGVPFGPDDYNALNPAIASTNPSGSGPDYSEITGMIITHDGKEVDPSDHLPIDTWAPEPEPKKPSSSASSPAARPSPAGPQSLPASGRRPLRIAGRTSTMAADGYISGDLSFDAPSPTPAAPTGRNRLQKKAHRQSAAPVMSGAIMSGANGSGPGTSSLPQSPLGPLPNSHDNFTPPSRSLPRAQTFDYAPERENHAPGYSPSPYDRRNGMGNGASAPPVPAKVPLALPAPGGRYDDPRAGGGYDEWGGMAGGGGTGEDALLEEMRRIDIGTGSARARRPGQGYGRY